MSQAFIRDLLREVMVLTLELSLPVLVAGLGVGLLVSLLQAVTQVQEMTLTFVPKAVAFGVMVLLAGPWMLDQLIGFTLEIYAEIPNVTARNGGGP